MNAQVRSEIEMEIEAIEGSIEKWEGGVAEAKRGLYYFTEWWREIGVANCAMCDYFKIKGSCNHCPLWVQNVSRVCASEWETLHGIDQEIYQAGGLSYLGSREMADFAADVITVSKALLSRLTKIRAGYGAAEK